MKLKPPKVQNLAKKAEHSLETAIDLTELEPLEGNDRMYFCRKDFGCSRVITKEIEKVVEIRKLNVFIAMNRSNLDQKALQRLIDYKVLIESFIQKFASEKINYQKRYPHIKHNERNSHKWKFEALQISGKKTIENASKDS